MNLKNQFSLIIIVAVMLIIAVQLIYYFEVTRTASKKIDVISETAVAQIVETTQIILDKARTAAIYFSYSRYVQSFMTSTDPYEIYSMKKYIEDMIQTGVEINNEIENIILLTPEWKRLYYYNDNRMWESLETIRESVGGDTEMPGFYYVKGGLLDQRTALIYYMPVNPSATVHRKDEKIGSILIFLNPNIIRDMINRAVAPEDVELWIVDHRSQIVASNTYASPPSADAGALAIRKEISNFGWTMLGDAKGGKVLRDYEYVKRFSLTTGVIMILLLVSLGIAFNRNFAKPLTLLFKEIGEIGKEDYRNKLKKDYKHEMNGIAIHINRMLGKLEALNEQHLETLQHMFKIELSRKQTELYALQSQVNPHFLFNTLQCIGGIALAEDVPEVARVTACMASILNYGIKGPDHVRLADEVAIAKQYLQIIDIRFGERVRWEFQIQPELLEQTIMKMIFQPLVENAVNHGLENTGRSGRLMIGGWLEKGNMLLEIKDDGPGFDLETLEKFIGLFADSDQLEKEYISKQKIGIANIHWRIRLTYGEPYGLFLFNRPEGGAVVRILLPYHRNI